jgi:3',5'-cyclic AMP phosphodiesterase CpdA
MPSKQLRIAQISDLHIKPPGTLAYARVDTAKALERCVATLNAFEPAPDFVVISGDLADTPNAEEYDHLKQLLAPLFRTRLTPLLPARSTRRSRSASSMFCCLIPACPARRMAN